MQKCPLNAFYMIVSKHLWLTGHHTSLLKSKLHTFIIPDIVSEAYITSSDVCLQFRSCVLCGFWQLCQPVTLSGDIFSSLLSCTQAPQLLTKFGLFDSTNYVEGNEQLTQIQIHMGDDTDVILMLFQQLWLNSFWFDIEVEIRQYLPNNSS